jgi:hypothetical protein
VGPVFAVLDVNRASRQFRAPRERAATAEGEDLASQSTEWKLYPPLVTQGETIEIEASSGTSNGTKPTRELQSGLAKTQAAD